MLVGCQHLTHTFIYFSLCQSARPVITSPLCVLPPPPAQWMFSATAAVSPLLRRCRSKRHRFPTRCQCARVCPDRSRPRALIRRSALRRPVSARRRVRSWPQWSSAHGCYVHSVWRTGLKASPLILHCLFLKHPLSSFTPRLSFRRTNARPLLFFAIYQSRPLFTRCNILFVHKTDSLYDHRLNFII